MFTDEQLKNTAVFLGRVDLKGAEVPAYVDVSNAINNELAKRGSTETQTEETGTDSPELLNE